MAGPKPEQIPVRIADPDPEEPKPPKLPEIVVRHGPPRFAHFHTIVMVGNRQISTNNRVENGKEGWHLVEEGTEWLLIGHGDDQAKPRHWTRVHWSNVRQLQYWPEDRSW